MSGRHHRRVPDNRGLVALGGFGTIGDRRLRLGHQQTWLWQPRTLCRSTFSASGSGGRPRPSSIRYPTLSRRSSRKANSLPERGGGIGDGGVFGHRPDIGVAARGPTGRAHGSSRAPVSEVLEWGLIDRILQASAIERAA